MNIKELSVESFRLVLDDLLSEAHNLPAEYSAVKQTAKQLYREFCKLYDLHHSNKIYCEGYQNAR